jgi:hypothetical protein
MPEEILEKEPAAMLRDNNNLNQAKMRQLKVVVYRETKGKQKTA